jgi:hypothetical protein
VALPLLLALAVVVQVQLLAELVARPQLVVTAEQMAQTQQVQQPTAVRAVAVLATVVQQQQAQQASFM